MSKTIYEAVTVTIDPMKEEVKVETKKRGVSSIKNISTEELLRCFQSSYREYANVSTGFLPENCLWVDIRDSCNSFIIRHPLLHCEYTYFKSLYENFPIPRMVFAFDIISSGRVVGYRMAVMEDETPKPTTRLYEYPFSNVYDDTRICVGAANELPVYKNTCALASLPNHILSLPNNDHNFSRANNRLNLGYRELLDHLRDKPPAYYYEKVLVPRRDKKTLQDFIDRNMN